MLLNLSRDRVSKRPELLDVVLAEGRSLSGQVIHHRSRSRRRRKKKKKKKRRGKRKKKRRKRRKKKSMYTVLQYFFSRKTYFGTKRKVQQQAL